MNGLRNLDETYRKYLLAHSDNLIRFLKSEVNSKVKVAAGRRGGEDVIPLVPGSTGPGVR